MRFTLIVFLLALAASANAAVSASQMTSNIDAITQLSSDTNDIAMDISVTNLVSATSQMIGNFKQIIETAKNDINAINSKGSIEARQECLDVTDVERCLQDIGEIVKDPSQVSGKKRHATSAYSDTEQQAVCTSFRSFVMVHKGLLKTVIGKHGLLSLTPFTHPIAAVLRALESGVDSLAFGIIDSVPTCVQDATQNKSSLDSTLGDTMDTYEN